MPFSFRIFATVTSDQWVSYRSYTVRITAAFTGITLGFNLFNALVIGILGLPGLVLLLLTQWVL